MQLNLTNITYTYPGASNPAVGPVAATFPQGWTGIVGDNGCGKTTLARLACGLVRPDSGTVAPKLFSVYCQQDSSMVPNELEDFAADWGREAQELRRVLGIEDEWLWRYDTLSGGQQKRIQIGCALWRRPDVLVMDEPTNDLDATTRHQVTKALASFSGIGLLISHDRTLLDALVSQCLLFAGGCFTLRPGTYSQAAGQAGQERNAALREREKAKREKRRLEAEATRRRVEADRSQAKRSARKLDKHDSDGRERLGRAIVSGKDGVAAKLSASMAGRVAKADEALQAATVEKRYAGRFRSYGEAASAKTLIHQETGALSAGDFTLDVPELWIGPTDHVVLTGDNGNGKSLLVHQLLSRCHEGVKTAYVPQEVSDAVRAEALAKLAQLAPADRGRVLAIVGGLNSDPERLVDGADISPGELKKLLLAEQLVENPNLLVLDEPTNHLDMGSIDALAALLEEFPGAFLLVTHDESLQDSLEGRHWRIERKGSRCRLVV
ncbi:ATP-binding cassette domain-containing protein [uncultured Adlercreutzia sp.]|uniref:ATP-binding cassette domain-containing protein n=1 Tax=uncultured Adlercreutzia sp. TaxID=875803 RepID=UPI0025E2FE35|nr:ATP-binding cassette domain-containing protein [uncultured Adlercreutzia sp.]MCI9260877.1 ABC-F family ATP-binding cassette domain-containing protein [Eggerthellaceae bacterium]